MYNFSLKTGEYLQENTYEVKYEIDKNGMLFQYVENLLISYCEVKVINGKLRVRGYNVIQGCYNM